MEQTEITLEGIHRHSAEQIDGGGITEGYSDVGSMQYYIKLQEEYAKLKLAIDAASGALGGE